MTCLSRLRSTAPPPCDAGGIGYRGPHHLFLQLSFRMAAKSTLFLCRVIALALMLNFSMSKILFLADCRLHERKISCRPQDGNVTGLSLLNLDAPTEYKRLAIAGTYLTRNLAWTRLPAKCFSGLKVSCNSGLPRSLLV